MEDKFTSQEVLDYINTQIEKGISDTMELSLYTEAMSKKLDIDEYTLYIFLNYIDSLFKCETGHDTILKTYSHHTKYFWMYVMFWDRYFEYIKLNYDKCKCKNKNKNEATKKNVECKCVYEYLNYVVRKNRDFVMGKNCDESFCILKYFDEVLENINVEDETVLDNEKNEKIENLQHKHNKKVELENEDRKKEKPREYSLKMESLYAENKNFPDENIKFSNYQTANGFKTKEFMNEKPVKINEDKKYSSIQDENIYETKEHQPKTSREEKKNDLNYFLKNDKNFYDEIITLNKKNSNEDKIQDTRKSFKTKTISLNTSTNSGYKTPHSQRITKNNIENKNSVKENDINDLNFSIQKKETIDRLDNLHLFNDKKEKDFSELKFNTKSTLEIQKALEMSSNDKDGFNPVSGGRRGREDVKDTSFLNYSPYNNFKRKNRRNSTEKIVISKPFRVDDIEYKEMLNYDDKFNNYDNFSYKNYYKNENNSPNYRNMYKKEDVLNIESKKIENEEIFHKTEYKRGNKHNKHKMIDQNDEYQTNHRNFINSLEKDVKKNQYYDVPDSHIEKEYFENHKNSFLNGRIEDYNLNNVYMKDNKENEANKNFEEKILNEYKNKEKHAKGFSKKKTGYKIEFKQDTDEYRKDITKDINKITGSKNKTEIEKSKNITDQHQNNKVKQISKENIDENENKNMINGKEFKILKIIGKGGCGKVYSVLLDSEIYALKKIRTEGEAETVIKYYRSEIQILEKFRGFEEIIQIIEFEEKKDEIYILMEFGECDLTQILKNYKLKQKQKIKLKLKSKSKSNFEFSQNNNFNEKEQEKYELHESCMPIHVVRYFWIQMLKIVERIHSERIVHRDLKPANFLLVKGKLKLIDFGIAKTIRDNTTNIHTNTQMGTINYMAPEALDTSNKVGRQADIWSLGCILYEMVYGRVPLYKCTTLHQKYSALVVDQNFAVEYPFIEYNSDCTEKNVKNINEINQFDPVKSKSNIFIYVIQTMKMALKRDPHERGTLNEIMKSGFGCFEDKILLERNDIRKLVRKTLKLRGTADEDVLSEKIVEEFLKMLNR